MGGITKSFKNPSLLAALTHPERRNPMKKKEATKVAALEEKLHGKKSPTLGGANQTALGGEGL